MGNLDARSDEANKRKWYSALRRADPDPIMTRVKRRVLVRGFLHATAISSLLSIPVFLNVNSTLLESMHHKIDFGFSWDQGALAPPICAWLNPLGSAFLIKGFDNLTPQAYAFFNRYREYADLLASFVYFLWGILFWTLILALMRILWLIHKDRKHFDWASLATVILVLGGSYALYGSMRETERFQRLERRLISLSVPDDVDPWSKVDTEFIPKGPVVIDRSNFETNAFDFWRFWNDPLRKSLSIESSAESIMSARTALREAASDSNVNTSEFDQVLAAMDNFHASYPYDKRDVAPVRCEKLHVKGRTYWVCECGWEDMKSGEMGLFLSHIEIFVIDAKTWSVVGWVTCL